MSVLVDYDIEEYVKSINLISDFEKSCLEPASYDLRIGKSYMQKRNIETMSDESNQSISLSPGEYVIITSHEYLNFPLDLIGHFGLTSIWGMKGIISLFGPQIDPGFSGMLVVPIFNAGDTIITLPYKEKMFTVEFHKTTKKASRSWSDRYGKQDRIKALHTAFESKPNLLDFHEIQEKVSLLIQENNDIKIKVTNNQNSIDFLKENRNLKLTIFGMFIGILGLVIGLISSPYFSEKTDNKVVEENKKDHNQTVK